MMVLEYEVTARVTPEKKDILITDNSKLHAKLIEAIERAKALEGPYQEIISIPEDNLNIYQVIKDGEGRIMVYRYFPIIYYSPVPVEKVSKKKLNKPMKEAGLG